MNAAELLVHTMEGFGVDTVFGYPGAHNLAIYDALFDSSIRHVLVRHEQAAAFMADGYARASGRVGVCLTTSGPGATNAATAIAEAFTDSIPVLHLSAQVESGRTGRDCGAYHELDLVDVFRPMTKWAAQAGSAHEVAGLLCEAFRQLTTGRPRPVHLALPHDLLKAETSAPVPSPAPAAPAAPDAGAIAAAADAIGRSRRPMVLAGGGVISAAAAPELTRLAEALAAPTAATTMGRGSFPEDHPLALGWARGQPARAALEEADLLVAAGCRFGEITTGRWTVEFPPLVHLDVDPGEIGKNVPARVGVVGDAKLALDALLDALPGEPREPWLAPTAPQHTAEDRIDRAIVPVLRERLRRDAIVAADVGMTVFHMFTSFPVYEPRTFLHPATYIAMGHAFPAALGAKVAMPGRQVVCLTGDGAFMMVCAEMATAVQERIAVPVIVVNDGQLGAIKRIQQRQFSGRYIAVDLVNPDFGRLAGAFGAGYENVRDAGGFGPALDRALSSEGPTLIEVVKPGI